MNLSDCDCPNLVTQIKNIHKGSSNLALPSKDVIKNLFNNFIEIPHKNQEELAKVATQIYNGRFINWNYPIFAHKDEFIKQNHYQEELYFKMRRGIVVSIGGGPIFGYYFYLDDLNPNVKVYYSPFKFIDGYGLIVFLINERFAGALHITLNENGPCTHNPIDLSPDLFRDCHENANANTALKNTSVLEEGIKRLNIAMKDMGVTIKKNSNFNLRTIKSLENRLFTRFINYTKEEENKKDLQKIGWFQ